MGEHLCSAHKPSLPFTQSAKLSIIMERQINKDQGNIKTEDNHVLVIGKLGVEDFHRLLAAIHDRVEGRGYKKVILDFSDCTATFAGPMLAVCAQTIKLRRDGIDVSLVLPKKENIERLFVNTNWAHMIDPARHDVSRFKGYSQVPVTQFFSASDQHKAVNAIMDAMLRSLTDLSRGDLAAIEWSVNEISDNVINHSNSQTGGLVQLTTFKKEQHRVEYAVCDAGIGIPNSLRQTHPEITSDSDALDRAIREGVTRDKAIGMGNGLFGSFEICRVSEGYFEVHSGYARLSQNKQKGLHVRLERVPYAGTLVVACVDYSKRGVLQEALRFGNKNHLPVRDYIEAAHESDDGARIVFVMSKEAESFGTRVAGRPVKIKLQNLSALCPAQKVFIDFSDVPVISSSFADEVLGKLFLELGPLAFMQRFEVVNTTDAVRGLIDRAIGQRAAKGRAED
jgi:anti-anti-sigma regulatory factor/anti-sigma regulatory factor (Ser/Thr protein kinase)